MRSESRWILSRLGAVFFGYLVVLAPATADVVTDGTVGPAGPLAGPNVTISADVGRQAGKNLFHSFKTFNIYPGESATFTGSGNLENVISRVTGGKQSTIDGLLSSKILNADFWFFNPAGVVFGPNAQLDVQASFHVSTADELRFGDGAVFSARDPSASTLTIAAPQAFGFLAGNSASISFHNSTLEVPDGHTISIVAKDILTSGAEREDQAFGFLKAPGGQINIFSVAPPSEVRPDKSDFDRLPINEVGKIKIIYSGLADNISVDNIDGTGGVVSVVGGRIVVDDARILSGTSGLVRIKGAQLIITREGINGESQSTSGTIKIDVTGDMILDQSQLLTDSDVTPSIITINAGRVVLKGGGQIITETRGEGRGGDVTINAKESVSISGSGFHNSVSFTGDGFVASVAGPFLSGITTQTLGAGDGGNINIRAPVLEVIGGEIKASASNDYGNVQGRAGNITLEVGNLSVIKGGNISSITQGPGKGGNVSITGLNGGASGEVLISGFRGSELEPDFKNAPSTLSVVTEDGGVGGTVNIAAETIHLSDGGLIDARSTGPGDAGTITITAERLMLGRSTIGTQSQDSGGGQITLYISKLLDLTESDIKSNVSGPPNTTAGNIRIDPQFLVLDNSNILARAFQGRGGKIDIDADFILRSAESRIDASSELGIDGTITASNPEIDLSKGLRELPVDFLDASAQMPLSCEARRASGESNFGMIGRGVPPGPDAPSPGFYLLDHDAGAGPGTSDSGKLSEAEEVEIASFGWPTIHRDCSTR